MRGVAPGFTLTDVTNHRLVVLLLHSTDEPDLAVAGLRIAAHGAAILALDGEGVRLAAQGVAETLSGGPRPDVKTLLGAVPRTNGEILVQRDAWRERGYQDSALVAGAMLVGAETWARLAREGVTFVTY